MMELSERGLGLRGSGSSAVRVSNARSGRVLAERCGAATSPLARFLGLMGRASLPAGEGLLISPCSSVHCFFMRFPIDVAFLDGEGRVVKLYAPLRPWRTSSPIIWRAKRALELPAGTIATSDTRVGDVLLLGA